MANRIQIRRDSEANWESINPVLADGEPGLNYDNNQVKYGDGESDWITLTYSTGNLSWGDDVRGSITDVISEGFQTGNLIIDSSNGSASASVNRDIRLISHGPGGGTSNPHEWAFDSTGNLTLPNDSVIGEVTVNSEYGILLTPSPISGANPDMAVKIYPTFNDDDHIHITAGNPSTVDLFLGDDDQYVKIEADGGNIVISADDDLDIKWTFGTNGKLSKLGGVTLTAGGDFNICTINDAGSGYTGDDPLPATTTGGSGTGMTVAFGYGLSGQLANVSVVDPGTGYTNGDVIGVDGGTGNFILTQYNVLGNQANSNFAQAEWTFSPDGKTRFPGELYGARYRGTTNAPAAVAQDDTLMEFGALGWDGAALNGGGELMWSVDGTVTQGVSNPSRADIYVTRSGNVSQTLGLTVDSALTVKTYGRLQLGGTVPTHSYGAAGDTAGMFASDATYFYYCTANYVDVSTDIWKRTAHGAGTW